MQRDWSTGVDWGSEPQSFPFDRDSAVLHHVSGDVPHDVHPALNYGWSGLVPVSDFDLGTHPRAGSTRGARVVGAGTHVRRLAMVWRVPDELPFIVLKDPSEKIEDRSFHLRKQKLLDALLYLKSHNEHYRHIVISRENADLYPEDDIIQSLPQLDPQEMKSPDEEPTAANEDSAR
ncbi:hypothetical protein ACOMHN_005380 [Nucella lapillus]